MGLTVVVLLLGLSRVDAITVEQYQRFTELSGAGAT
jgi:hypothetical protein